MSLKTEIESTISQAVEVIAGAASLDVDTRLEPEDRLLSNEFGALPLDSEYTEGPLVRIMITDFANVGEEFGDEANRVTQLLYGITIAGITRLCDNPGESGQIGSDTEEIVRLHLQHLTFDIETAYDEGRNSYATELRFQGSSFDTSTVSGRQTAPVVEAAVPLVGNSGTGTLRVDADQAYAGRQDETLTVSVVTPNTAPNVNTGLTIRFRVGSGSWSSPIPVGNNPVPLAFNIWVLMSVTGIVSAGDAWTIHARTNELYSIGMWVQSWVMSAEATAVF